VDNAEIATVKKDITSVEACLSKLEQQEEKYFAQLETAFSKYANLKAKGADFESAELYAQRMVLRPNKIAAVVDRIQSAYGEKYDPLIMFDSKQDVTELLHDEDESRAYEQKPAQARQQEHESTQKEKYKHHKQER